VVEEEEEVAGWRKGRAPVGEAWLVEGRSWNGRFARRRYVFW
jgi:hypothetical protein